MALTLGILENVAQADSLHAGPAACATGACLCQRLLWRLPGGPLV